jgi:dipeptidyl aminopeptidase/acylaminoacyl peptidase
LALAVILLGLLAYTIVWASIWDQTSDGLGGLALSQPAGLVAVAAGMVMAATSSGWRRLAGLAFAVLVPLAVFGAFSYGWDVSYHALTESRAARIQEALERFRTRTGGYPAGLKELVPSELWWIPEPVILSGQGWCYQGGPDYYRLGAIYREFFGMPLSVHLYASAGSPPETSWECDEKLAELKPRYEPQPMVGIPDTVPTLAPLPTSVVAVQRTSVQPLIRSSSIGVGKWSPDGSYLVFSLPEIAGDQSVMSLNFLKADMGEVCQAGQTKWVTEWASDGLREHFAWLPDGRLLFVSESGEILLFKPCTADVENLTSRYPVTFTHAVVYDEQSGRVLLKNPESYWVLDGVSLEARQIPGVSPNPYEAHWDRYAWSPGGDRLAIARLNGRDRQDGTTLYIVEGATGAVEKSLPLVYASDQSAPMVEWLTNDELLIHGGAALTVMDLRSEPPQFTDLLKDVFLLDVAYPDDFSSMASVVDKAGGGYHVAARVNHPRNQAIYVYHSETGQVEVLQSDVDLLLFFPDGEWTELTKFEAIPTYRDEYELVWVDTPEAEPRRLVVQGHVPRNYPDLNAEYLPGSSRMVFSSSQGVSLVSIPDGALLGFWELAGGSASPSTFALASPDGKALVAIVERVGLYYIPLPNK